MINERVRFAMAISGMLGACCASAATPWSAQDYDLYSGDFNGDGKTDILHIAKDASKPSGIAIADGSGPNTLWQSWSSNYLGIQWYGGLYTALVGYFNDDTRADVLLQRTTPGDSYLLLSDANGRLTGISQTIAQSALGLTWSKDQHSIFPGDFSGDNFDDLFFQAANPSGTHAVPLANSAGQFLATPTQSYTDAGWPAFRWSRRNSTITVGDFNGDGLSDLLIQGRPDIVMVNYDVLVPIAVYKPNSFGVVYSQGGATPFQQAGVRQWSWKDNNVDWSPLSVTAIVADFNGDGRDDVLLQARSPARPSYLLTGNASGAVFSAPTTVTTNVTISSDGARLIAGRFSGSNIGPAGVYIQATTATGTNYVAPAVGTGTSAVEHDPTALVAPAEIVTYSYDAKGRLVTVSRLGGVNNNVQTQYTYDKANNRKTLVTTGSGN